MQPHFAGISFFFAGNAGIFSLRIYIILSHYTCLLSYRIRVTLLPADTRITRKPRISRGFFLRVSLFLIPATYPHYPQHRMVALISWRAEADHLAIIYFPYDGRIHCSLLPRTSPIVGQHHSFVWLATMTDTPGRPPHLYHLSFFWYRDILVPPGTMSSMPTKV